MSFASLKSKSGKFAKLTQQIENLSKPQGRGPDERLWKPEVDKSGNGYAVIRFLPEPDGEDLPWAQVWSHACLLYTSPSPRDRQKSRMPSSA